MDGYLGEIKIWAGMWAPRGWMFCQGQILEIRQNTVLYTLLQQTYGGNGQTTFALPNLCGRVPIGVGQIGAKTNIYQQGRIGGSETHTLQSNELANHSHSFGGTFNATSALKGATDGTSTNSVDTTKDTYLDATGVKAGLSANANIYATNATQFAYIKGVETTISAGSGSTGTTGNSAPFSIVQPYLPMNYIICVYGSYPEQE